MYLHNFVSQNLVDVILFIKIEIGTFKFYIFKELVQQSYYLRI